ncbi:hypothetical protein NDU88_000388 [Pleurodeles waltl]|uniref:Uncharacterized protein n=1 Tax=Pleurodeles waltl TaxID=8319 RepID=A0AAV7NB81_PLEWA|nr:hypothetical protein NDU88_000388 [Pleurodeles waltl]
MEGNIIRLEAVALESGDPADRHRLQLRQQDFRARAENLARKYTLATQHRFYDVGGEGKRGNTILEPNWVNNLLAGRVVLSESWMNKERVKKEKSKLNFDKTNAVKKTVINVDDWILIKNPLMKKKLSGPMKVVKLFTNAIKTDDDRIWNLNRVVKYRGDHSVLDKDGLHRNDFGNSSKVTDLRRSKDVTDDSSRSLRVRRSNRTVKFPSHLKD